MNGWSIRFEPLRFFVHGDVQMSKLRVKILRPPWNLTILSIELGYGAENREIIKKNHKICLFSPKIHPKSGLCQEEKIFFFKFQVSKKIFFQVLE